MNFSFPQEMELFPLLLDERLQVLSSLLCRDALASIVEVDEHVAVIAHAKFLHVGKLSQTMACLHALHKVVVLLGCHGIDDVDTSLVDGEDVGRRENAHVWRDYRSS